VGDNFASERKSEDEVEGNECQSDESAKDVIEVFCNSTDSYYIQCVHQKNILYYDCVLGLHLFHADSGESETRHLTSTVCIWYNDSIYTYVVKCT
jgi:hypothetical protein